MSPKDGTGVRAARKRDERIGEWPRAMRPEARRVRAELAKSPELEEEYPFDSHFLDVDGPGLHYLDEGPIDSDAPVLMVHGNPTWSFYFRKLVLAMRERRRVIVPDHIGCGLSDKPQKWPYTLEAHVENLARLVRRLDLENLTLLVHDWGGPIGFGMARLEPRRVGRLVVLNSAAFRSKRLPLRIRACRTPLLGSVAVRGLNLFARAATTMAVEKHERMTPAIKRGYLAPYADYAARVALWQFVQDIPLSPGHRSWDTLVAIEESLKDLADRPTCIVWGQRDWCFTPAFLEGWRERFPAAEVHRLEDAGHYVLEDAHEEALAHVEAFLARRSES
jgi:haloalkane dehalogenase